MLDQFFSEKFMEDCICESPSSFLGEGWKISERQPSLFGFYPDLIVVNGTRTRICEIQRHALDRNHLYKTLEYRDYLREKTGDSSVEAVLVCEKIEERFLRILRTHAIELIALDRESFLRIATSACPNSVFAALQTLSSKDELEKPSTHEARVFPVFNSNCAAATLLFEFDETFKSKQLAWKDFPSAFGAVHQDITHEITCDRRHIEFAKKYLRPSQWDFERLRQVEGKAGLRRPTIGIRTYVTSKKNLTVRVDPYSDYPSNQETDWLSFPEDEVYAYNRPYNEMFYIREFGHLGTHYEQLREFADYPKDIDLIAGDLIGITLKYIEESLSDLAVFLDVKHVQKWNLKLEYLEKAPFGGRARVDGYEVTVDR
jgi:hypothetical protein